MSYLRLHRSRAFAALLLFILLAFPACASQQVGSGEDQNAPEATRSPQTATQSADSEKTDRDEKSPEKSGKSEKKDGGKSDKKTVEAVLPEDVLSEDEIAKPPKSKDWNAPGGEVVSVPGTAGTSVGTIPAVKPFNFGRDPGGPEVKTLYMGIPKLGLDNVPVFNSTSEEGLRKGTVHVPATGFPWQKGANVYIAGHRLGYPDTGSFRVFYDLDLMRPGDEIILRDASGKEYVYRVTLNEVVGPENVEVMNPVKGKSIVTLQTCTLPDYSERIIVQAELVEKNA